MITYDAIDKVTLQKMYNASNDVHIIDWKPDMLAGVIANPPSPTYAESAAFVLNNFKRVVTDYLELKKFIEDTRLNFPETAYELYEEVEVYHLNETTGKSQWSKGIVIAIGNGYVIRTKVGTFTSDGTSMRRFNEVN